MVPLPDPIPPIPPNTARAAKAAYSQDNFFLIVGSRLEQLIAGLPQIGYRLAVRSFQREKPHLAMITVFQYIEKVSDSQAMEATRTRLDWKFALHLSQNYPGLPAKFLCEYRQWLLQHPVYQLKFQKLLNHMSKDGLLPVESGRSLDAAKVLEEVCTITRSAQVAQAFQSALEGLATFQPEWLRKISLPHWYLQPKTGVSRPGVNITLKDRLALLESLGADSYYLLERYKCDASPEWGTLEEIQDLEDIWAKQYKHLPTGKTVLLDRCANC